MGPAARLDTQVLALREPPPQRLRVKDLGFRVRGLGVLGFRGFGV